MFQELANLNQFKYLEYSNTIIPKRLTTEREKSMNNHILIHIKLEMPILISSIYLLKIT